MDTTHSSFKAATERAKILVKQGKSATLKRDRDGWIVTVDGSFEDNDNSIWVGKFIKTGSIVVFDNTIEVAGENKIFGYVPARDIMRQFYLNEKNDCHPVSEEEKDEPIKKYLVWKKLNIESFLKSHFEIQHSNESLLESNIIKKLLSPDGRYLCYLNLENEDCNVFLVKNDILHFIKTISGQGVFLNSSYLLMFYNNSGYGYSEHDSYLYELKSSIITALYYNNYKELHESNTFSGGYFISFSSNILVTHSYLIMKDEHGGIYFYQKNTIIENKRMKPIFFLPVDGGRKIKKLLDYDELNSNLTFSNYSNIIESKKINLNESTPLVNSAISFNISNSLYYGFALDHHTISSKLNSDGTFDTIRTKLGECLYQLKYKNDFSKINSISMLAAMSIREIRDIDVIIPIPPSNQDRPIQPVFELGKRISELSSIPIQSNYLIKAKNTKPIKGVDDHETRNNLLNEAFKVPDKRFKGKSVLLFDDIYRSGATLNAAARVLKEQGAVGKIYVLTITKTTSNK